MSFSSDAIDRIYHTFACRSRLGYPRRTNDFLGLGMILRELIDYLEVQIVETLGEGLFGAAYLLDNGMVLKVTKDLNEPPCVARVADMEAWKLTPHLPYIHQYGWFENDFYYIREFTNQVEVDVPTQYSPEFFEWVKEIKEPIGQIEGILNCEMSHDAVDPANWGVRPGDEGVLVWRDLSCTCYERKGPPEGGPNLRGR